MAQCLSHWLGTWAVSCKSRYRLVNTTRSDRSPRYLPAGHIAALTGALCHAASGTCVGETTLQSPKSRWHWAAGTSRVTVAPVRCGGNNDLQTAKSLHVHHRCPGTPLNYCTLWHFILGLFSKVSAGKVSVWFMGTIVCVNSCLVVVLKTASLSRCSVDDLEMNFYRVFNCIFSVKCI